MATALERWKAIVGAFKNKNMDQPTDARALTSAQTMVRRWPREWNRFITKKGLIVNPDTPDDPFALGSMEPGATENDPEVFTPIATNRINRMTATHARKMLHNLLERATLAVRLDDDEIKVEDAGKTREQVRERILQDAKDEIKLIAGEVDVDDDDDPVA